MKFIELQISDLDKDVEREGRLATIAIDSIISIADYEGEPPAWKGVAHTSIMTFGRDGHVQTVRVSLHRLELQNMLGSKANPVIRRVARECEAAGCSSKHMICYYRPGHKSGYRCPVCGDMWLDERKTP